MSKKTEAFCSVIICEIFQPPKKMEKVDNHKLENPVVCRRQCSDKRRGSTLGPSGSFKRRPGWSDNMADGRKRPGPPEDSSSSRMEQRFCLPNYPDTRRRNIKKAIAGVLVVLGMFLAPGRGCCRRIVRIYLAWVLFSAVFRDVRSCLLCDDARDCWCGWWRSCFMARLSKITKKKTNNPALDNTADIFSWKLWKKKRNFGKFTSPIRTALHVQKQQQQQQ